ncbi:hypothetical protein V2A60_007265 [Cordyceps javanica]
MEMSTVQTYERRCRIEFPDELLLQIVGYLEDEDASCLVRVCRRFLDLLIYEYHRYDAKLSRRSSSDERG